MPRALPCALIYFGNVLWLWSGELLIPRIERELRCSEGSGMLIDNNNNNNLLHLYSAFLDTQSALHVRGESPHPDDLLW